MKTISLRKFRDSIPDLTEPVSVTRRSRDGEYVTLGTWLPVTEQGIAVPAEFPITLSPGFGTSRPAPKPKR